MGEVIPIRATLEQINAAPDMDKVRTVDEIQRALGAVGYSIAEREVEKPWGAYLRLENSDAEPFIEDFFPGLTLEEAQLGMPNAELSPKILVVAPGQRLSWQRHNRRAERWSFINSGLYVRSDTDVQGEPIVAKSGDVVQFAREERHRLIGSPDNYTFVAEIWQHTDPTNPSDEADIVRIEDDYKRSA